MNSNIAHRPGTSGHKFAALRSRVMPRSWASGICREVLSPTTKAAIALLMVVAACTPPKGVTGPAREQPISQSDGIAVSYVTTSRREGATQGFLLLRPPHPVASVILFPGAPGDGDVHISAAGIKGTENFLVRSRTLFAENDLLVAVVDAPSDRSTLSGFRTTEAHALDIKGVIAYLRTVAPVPVWLVGTSRGTVSVVNVAARLSEGGPDGIVVTSSIFLIGGAEKTPTVYSADLARIRIPTLVVHHRSDRCPVTPFAGTSQFMRSLVNAHPVELIPFEGGGPVRGRQCGAFDYHGYPGLEPQVVGAIATWIKAHPPS